MQLLSLNPQSFVNYVDTVWPLILEQKHDHKSFRRALKSFLNLVFSPVFLKKGQTCSRAVEELQYKVCVCVCVFTVHTYLKFL